MGHQKQDRYARIESTAADWSGGVAGGRPSGAPRPHSESGWAHEAAERMRGAVSGRPTGDRPASRLAGVLWGVLLVAIGIGCVAAGIPMLVLPGPGLLAIALGGWLVARGVQSVRLAWRRPGAATPR